MRVAGRLWIAVLMGVAWAAASLCAELRPLHFESNGDLIQGWYWLRDPGLQHKAWWRFEGISAGTEDLLLVITCLATSGVGGPRGSRPTFVWATGFPVRG